MANKNNIQSIDFNGKLNLNRFQHEIKAFEGFNKKNASIFGGVLTPFFNTSYDKDYFGINNKIYHVDENYSDNKIGLYKDDELITSLPKVSISKSIINIDKNILAFSFDENDSNIVHLFVEGELYYQFIDYSLESNSIIDTIQTSISVGKVTICDMINDKVVFYEENDGDLYIVTKTHNKHLNYSNNGSPIFTFNKLSSSFDYVSGETHYQRYLICYCGRSGNLSVNAGNVHTLVVYFGNDGSIHENEVTLVSSGLNSNQIPKYAPKVYGDNPKFYYVTDIENINQSTTTSPLTVYMTSTPTSLNNDVTELTVTCSNAITVKNDAINVKNRCSAEITPYFCSLLIGCNQNTVNAYFDSVNNCFIGNTGYNEIETAINGTSRYIPFGHKIDYCASNKAYNVSILMNYTNISNISVTLNPNTSGNRKSNIGSIVNEWNLIDGQSNIDVTYDSQYPKFLFKNMDNALSFVKITDEAPKYKTILDRYIVFVTPHYLNVYDTQKETFYHAFNDYNNRMIMCEKYGEKTISDFPTSYGLRIPSTYLYSSAINANMEISNINFSSIQYNPNIVVNGVHVKYLGEFKECGQINLNEKVDIYYEDSNTATTTVYKRSFTLNSSYYDNRLERIPYPITSNGNILYSTNIFSDFVNSFSNKDFIINDNVGYPLVYINNQPTLNYYFLSGIEFVNSAFILQGINYVNTNKYIFQVDYNGDLISYSQALVNIEGFKFIGNSTKCAFYYSSLTKSVYGFLGDRTLNKLIDCSAIDNIKNFFFNPKEYKIYIVTDKNIVVIDELTDYTIDIANVINMTFTNDYIIINYVEGETVKSELLTYYSYNNKSRLPINLATQFYGVGNNIKSVIDCVYIRLYYDYDENFNVKGDVKLRVNTLTDCGKKSEEKVFTILPADWDKESKTVYLRYQPKYQECIGMEVGIESPFAIATLDFGYSTDGTVQVSKFNV